MGRIRGAVNFRRTPDSAHGRRPTTGQFFSYVCFIIGYSAVGDGCPMLSNVYDASHQSIEYFIQAGVFFASTTCLPGFIFSASNTAATLIRCSNSAWTSPLPHCAAGKRFTVPYL